MEKLEFPVPEFRRSYRLRASLSQNGQKVELKGVDNNGANYTIFKQLKVSGLGSDREFPEPRVRDAQPYAVQIPQDSENEFNVQCQFFAKYQEPLLNLKVPMELLRDLGSVEFNMVYHVGDRRFEKVEMLASQTREVVGLAEFTTSDIAGAAANQPKRCSSPQQRIRSAA